MSDDAEMPSVKKQRGSSQNGNVEGALNESIRDYSVPLEGADLFVEDAEGGPPSPNPDIIPQSGGTFPLDNRESMDADNRPVCRYFLLGVCAYGDDCRFSHQIPPRKPGSDDYSNTQHLKTVAAGSNSRGAESKPSIQSDTHSSKTVCRFHGSLRGCKAGESCPFLHLDIPKKTFVPRKQGTEGENILSKYSSVKIAEKAGVETFTRKENRE